jgi:hypothetical protein
MSSLADGPRERYLAASTYLSSRSFPSALLKLPEEGTTSSSAVNTSPDEESHPVLLPGVDMLNRDSPASKTVHR